MKTLVATIALTLIAQTALAAEAGYAGRAGSLYTWPPQFGGHYLYHVNGGPQDSESYTYWLGQMRAPGYFYCASCCGGYSNALQAHAHPNNARRSPLKLLTGNRCQTVHTVIYR